jgi:hypothetical protein
MGELSSTVRHTMTVVAGEPNVSPMSPSMRSTSRPHTRCRSWADGSPPRRWRRQRRCPGHFSVQLCNEEVLVAANKNRPRIVSNVSRRAFPATPPTPAATHSVTADAPVRLSDDG